jgi:hypothetical protein
MSPWSEGRPTSRQAWPRSTSRLQEFQRRIHVGLWKGLTAEVDSEEVNDELGDLHGGEVLLPPDLAASGSSEVIVV